MYYRKALKSISGIHCFDDIPNVKHNYSYFPIFVNEKQYGMSRDVLYAKMRSMGIYGRRYFYPLITSFSTYRGLESASRDNLLEAHRMADEVICLPMHHNLSEQDVERILSCI